MTRQSLLGSSIFFLCLALVSGGRAQQGDQQWLNEDLMVEQLETDIWRHVSYRELERFGRSPANGLVVVSGNTAALVDTPWTDAQTLELSEWVSKNLGARIETVVVTHSHPDNMGGLVTAHELGAVSYSSAATAAFAQRDGGEIPQKTFTDSLVVKVGSRELQLYFPGPGHTAGNIVVWLPEELVLFGGCLVRPASAEHLGYTEEADLIRWPRTIESLLQRYDSVQLVVPGHGTPGGTELLQHTLQLLKKN